MSKKKTDQPNFALWTSIIGVIGVIIGAVIGYLGTKTSAEAAANAHITSVWIQVYGPIFTTQTAEARLSASAITTQPSETSAPAFTETPTTTSVSSPTEAFSDAIVVMKNFYDWINSARNKDDYLRSWNLETSGLNGFQCREAAGCNFSNFQNTWSEWKVQYKLYDCGKDLVDVQLRYYKRDPLLASTPSAPRNFRYRLVEIDGELKINNGYSIEAPGADCILVVTAP